MPGVIADCYQLSLNGHVETRPFANVFHCELLGASPPEPVLAAEILYEAYATAFADHMQDEWVYDSVSYVDLRTADGDSGTYVPPALSHGTATGNGASPQVAALIRWSAVGGRAQRSGRTYLPGIDEGSISSDGNLTTGLRDAITADAAQFMTELTAGDLGLCLVSRVGGATTGTVRTITGGQCQTVVATQRRRVRS